MTLNAAGPLSLPMAKLADLLAASETFRAAVGAADAAAALAFVHYPSVSLTGEGAVSRPFAVISDDDIAEWNYSTRGNAGQLVLTFELPTPEEYASNAAEAELWFRNVLGGILADMLELAGTYDGSGVCYWAMVAAEKLVTPAAANLEHEPEGTAPYYGASFLISWV